MEASEIKVAQPKEVSAAADRLQRPWKPQPRGTEAAEVAVEVVRSQSWNQGYGNWNQGYDSLQQGYGPGYGGYEPPGYYGYGPGYDYSQVSTKLRQEPATWWPSEISTAY